MHLLRNGIHIEAAPYPTVKSVYYQSLCILYFHAVFSSSLIICEECCKMKHELMAQNSLIIDKFCVLFVQI